MKPNLLKSSSVAVLEKETQEKEVLPQDAVQEKSVEKQVEPEQQSKQETKNDFFENKKSLFNAFSANFEQKQEKQAYIKQETPPQKQEQEKEQGKEQEVDELESESLLDFKTQTKPKKKTSGFRFKLITGIYAVVLAITVGWVGANAGRLAETQSLIHAQDVKYVQKIAELDKLKEKETNNDQLIPWDEFLPVQSVPLDDVTDYEQESNWFDNIINWFGKLFGG